MTSEFLSISTHIQEISGGKVVSFERVRYGWIAVVALGLSMFYIQGVVDPDNGAPTMALITLGLALAVLGVCRLCSRETVYQAGSERLALKDADFDLQQKAEVLKSFSSGDFSSLAGIGAQSAAKIKLRILSNPAFSLVYVQPFCYQPYNYFPCADARLLSEAEAMDLRKLLEQRKK